MISSHAAVHLTVTEFSRLGLMKPTAISSRYDAGTDDGAAWASTAFIYSTTSGRLSQKELFSCVAGHLSLRGPLPKQVGAISAHVVSLPLRPAVAFFGDRHSHPLRDLPRRLLPRRDLGGQRTAEQTKASVVHFSGDGVPGD